MRNLPPGPSAITMPIQLRRFIRDPAAFYSSCARRYGDPFSNITPFGAVVVTGTAAGARALFTADPATFAGASSPDVLAPFIGDKSVILLAGRQHARERKLLAPAFHGDRMKDYGVAMIEAAASAFRSLPRATPFRMLDLAQRITLRIMIDAVIGPDAPVGTRSILATAIFEHVSAMSPWMFVPSLRRSFGGVGPWARFFAARERLNTILYRLIREARGRSDAERSDILSQMVSARYEDGGRMSEQELRDEMVAVLFAGHETTAIAVAWAMYFLHRNPTELGALRAEIAENAKRIAIAKLPLLEAVCFESLRARPVVVDIPRVLREPMDFLGYHLEPGTVVSLSPLLLHAQPSVYTFPDRFLPRRFLADPPKPHEFAPFGGGARRCLGAAFALYEMKMVLATLLSLGRFSLLSEIPERHVRRGFVMAPENGVPMVLA